MDQRNRHTGGRLLSVKGASFRKFTGKMTMRQRECILHEFNFPQLKPNIFLLSLTAWSRLEPGRSESPATDRYPLESVIGATGSRSNLSIRPDEGHSYLQVHLRRYDRRADKSSSNFEARKRKCDT